MIDYQSIAKSVYERYEHITGVNPEALKAVIDREIEYEIAEAKRVESNPQISELPVREIVSCNSCGRHRYESSFSSNKRREPDLRLFSVRLEMAGGSGITWNLCLDCMGRLHEATKRFV